MEFPIDKNGVTKVIPQRAPFLFVDEITAADADSLRAAYTFRPENPIFAGHFPGDPIVPGVLIIEALAQTGAYFLLSKPENAGKNAYLLKAAAKFKRVVRPGERIDMTVAAGRVFMGTAECRAAAYVNGALAAECDIMCAFK